MKTITLKLSIAIIAIIAINNAFAQRNCGTMEYLEKQKAQNPYLEATMQKIENQTRDIINNGAYMKSAAVVVIPVVVHVVYRTSSENISDAQIQSQIAVLNEDFRRLNADKANTPSAFAAVAADVQVEFCLATVDAAGNPTTGITRTATTTTIFSDNDNVKYNSTGGKNAWSRDSYLNLWSCNLGTSLLGYAQFPGGAAATDGVVINYRYFGRGGSTQAPFNKGRTATHEVGHWLNLRHIWGDASCGNDYVSDTPTQQYSSSGCPSYPRSTCSSSDMFMNYMDYTDDACMNIFSAGQRDRMKALFSAGGSRAALLTSVGCSGVVSTGYCASKGNDASYEWIARVQVGNIDNSTGSNSGYADFTGVSTSLAVGNSISLTLTPGFASSTYSEYWKIWIDYNKDNDFGDAGELVYNAGTMSTSAVSGSFTVPSGAPTGTTRMRVSMKYNGAQTECEAFSYGEVEDYTVNITAPCNVPGSLTASSITANSATLKWASTGASSYGVRLKPTGASTWSTATSTTTSYNAASLLAATTYEFQVKSVCSGTSSAYSASATFTTLAASGSAYCASRGNNASYEWIAKVQVGSINNTSGSDEGYRYFSALSTDLQQGSNNTVTLTPGFSSSTYTEYWKIWIDFNQDGDFTDAGELAFDAGSMSSAVMSGTLVVPSTATLGTTRMRVSMKYNAAQSACEAFAYGEVEDYLVKIVQSSASYCASKGSNSSYEWIAGVKVGTINNITGNNGGYQSFTSISTDLETGSSFAVELTPGFSGTTYDEYWKIWIDYNKDGDFADAGEEVFNSGAMSKFKVTGSFIVPAGTPTGTTRMRVSMKYNGAQTSCETFSYGEVEDYTVVIVNNQKVASVTGITVSSEVAAQPDLMLYPNPAKENATILFTIPEGTKDVSLNVHDITGKVVHKTIWSNTDGEVTYNILFDELPAGIYQVSLQSSTFSAVRKLVVIK